MIIGGIGQKTEKTESTFRHLKRCRIQKEFEVTRAMWGQIDDPDSQKSKKLLFTRGNGVFRVFDEL